LRVEGLGHRPVGAARRDLRLVDAGLVRHQDQHRDVGGLRVGAELAGNFVAGRLTGREHGVDDQHVGRHLLGARDSLRPLAHGDHFAVLGREGDLDGQAHGLAVVDREDLGRHRGSFEAAGVPWSL
jgi:hypothetical protein